MVVIVVGGGGFKRASPIHLTGKRFDIMEGSFSMSNIEPGLFLNRFGQ